MKSDLSPSATSRRLKPYKCSICDKNFPSPEAGSAHLEKRHNGGGYMSWYKVLKGAYA